MGGANGVKAARCGGLARVGDGGRTLWAGGGGLRAERARRGGEWWVGWRLNEEREQVGVRESGRAEQGQVGWGGEDEVGSAAEGRWRVSGAGGCCVVLRSSLRTERNLAGLNVCPWIFLTCAFLIYF